MEAGGFQTSSALVFVYSSLEKRGRDKTLFNHQFHLCGLIWTPSEVITGEPQRLRVVGQRVSDRPVVWSASSRSVPRTSLEEWYWRIIYCVGYWREINTINFDGAPCRKEEVKSVWDQYDLGSDDMWLAWVDTGSGRYLLNLVTISLNFGLFLSSNF